MYIYIYTHILIYLLCTSCSVSRTSCGAKSKANSSQLKVCLAPWAPTISTRTIQRTTRRPLQVETLKSQLCCSVL